MHQSFSGQLCKCLQDDSDKGEGGIGGKQLKTEFSNLGRRSNVVAHESEDGNEAKFQSNWRGQTWRQKEPPEAQMYIQEKYSVLSVLPYGV